LGKIKVMDENLANKIAAGEVIERCASVVKELVENSIDAKSTNIEIHLLRGGIKEIRVIDNGVGMDREDAKIAFFRHATSKIYHDDDLFFIGTLGFRGEALPSIASVSEVELRTCSKDVGTYIHIKGGKIETIEDSQARIGTSITVSNLFYNTPARLKYLKTENTELSHSVNFIEKLAFAYPNISFLLTNEGKEIVKTSGSGSLLKAIHEIYGTNVSSNMVEINASNDDFHIKGYICKPSVLRNNRNDCVTFVNERLVRNNDINRAINDAYYLYKPVDRYPVVVINIEADPTLTDVNVHPTKQDVRISKMDELYELIYTTIKNTLYSTTLIPKMEVADQKGRDLYSGNIATIESSNTYDEKEATTITQIEMQFDGNEEIVKNDDIKKLDLELIGVIHATYIVAADKDGMYLLDQHAVHERINYEKNMKAFANKEIYSTKLLVPYVIEMTPSKYKLFKEREESFTKLGFKYEEFGINTISITEHPTWLNDGYKDEFPDLVIDLLLDDKKDFSFVKFQESVIKMMSCKMSIRANEVVSKEVLQYLIKELFKCDNPYTCCHGRPTIMKYSNYDLEKMFKRVD